jgi:hypothetical protein
MLVFMMMMTTDLDPHERVVVLEVHGLHVLQLDLLAQHHLVERTDEERCNNTISLQVSCWWNAIVNKIHNNTFHYHNFSSHYKTSIQSDAMYIIKARDSLGSQVHCKVIFDLVMPCFCQILKLSLIN